MEPPAPANHPLASASPETLSSRVPDPRNQEMIKVVALSRDVVGSFVTRRPLAVTAPSPGSTGAGRLGAGRKGALADTASARLARGAPALRVCLLPSRPRLSLRGPRHPPRAGPSPRGQGRLSRASGGRSWGFEPGAGVALGPRAVVGRSRPWRAARHCRRLILPESTPASSRGLGCTEGHRLPGPVSRAPHQAASGAPGRRGPHGLSPARLGGRRPGQAGTPRCPGVSPSLLPSWHPAFGGWPLNPHTRWLPLGTTSCPPDGSRGIGPSEAAAGSAVPDVFCARSPEGPLVGEPPGRGAGESGCQCTPLARSPLLFPGGILSALEHPPNYRGVLRARTPPVPAPHPAALPPRLALREGPRSSRMGRAVRGCGQGPPTRGGRVPLASPRPLRQPRL